MLGGTLTILTEEGAVLEIFRQGPVLIADNQGTSGVYDLSANAKDCRWKTRIQNLFFTFST